MENAIEFNEFRTNITGDIISISYYCNVSCSIKEYNWFTMELIINSISSKSIENAKINWQKEGF